VTDRGSTQIPDDVIEFVNKHITTVWALELLLFMRQGRSRAWTIDELAKELRASTHVVTRVMPGMTSAGLVTGGEGAYRYSPIRPELDDTVERLEAVYKQLPVTIVRHIALAAHREAQSFADAFKFRKD
jgi:hypothetical protein